jgi:hypothetical protein
LTAPSALTMLSIGACFQIARWSSPRRPFHRALRELS